MGLCTYANNLSYIK